MIVGIGEDGPAGLTDASRDALAGAEIIFGGPRHLDLAGAGARGRAWPVPFAIAPVLECRGRRVVVLASGDPFWMGAGGSIAAHLAPGEWRALPAPGVFSLAAARLGWRIEQTTCIGLHAAPFGRLLPHLARGCRIIATLRDGPALADLADWLRQNGAGAIRITVFERLGGPQERLSNLFARDPMPQAQAPVAVALDGADLPADAGISAVPGRPDSLFASDGQITRSPVRAITLAALAPRAGALLWDIGGGSGSISVEWGLAGGRAICVEPRADRLENIRANVQRFGLTGRVEARQGRAPDALSGLPAPDAVFVGGGASEALFTALWPAMPVGARLVANAVTLESEALLTDLHHRHGGQLLRLEISEAAPLGRMRGWQPQRPVTQWQVTR